MACFFGEVVDSGGGEVVAQLPCGQVQPPRGVAWAAMAYRLWRIGRLNPQTFPLSISRFCAVADQTSLLRVVELYVVNNFA